MLCLSNQADIVETLMLNSTFRFLNVLLNYDNGHFDQTIEKIKKKKKKKKKKSLKWFYILIRFARMCTKVSDFLI